MIGRQPAQRRRIQRHSLIVIAALAASVAGCRSPYSGEKWPPTHATRALANQHVDYAAVQLFYVTDRNLPRPNDPRPTFGNERSRELKYGVGQVSIPQGHLRGRLESPRLFQRASNAKHVLLAELERPIDASEFMERLHRRIEMSARREVFVFVHGFAIGFEEAARRTAQIAHDVDLNGVAVVYSWPARGWILSYLVDADNAEWSASHFVDFLDRLVRESGAERIHLMAHSLGARLLSRALQRYMTERRCGDGPAFDQIVLAAADIDADIFQRDFAPFVAGSARRVTIYVSRADWALGGSKWLHLYVRLGQDVNAGRSNGSVTQNIDIIDATAVDKGVVGHVYYGESPSILEDLRQVFQGAPPAERGLIAHDGYFEVPAAGHGTPASTAEGVRRSAPRSSANGIFVASR